MFTRTNLVRAALCASTVGLLACTDPMEPENEVIPEELPEPDARPTALYQVGCAGLIERCDRLADGRARPLQQLSAFRALYRQPSAPAAGLRPSPEAARYGARRAIILEAMP